MGDDSFCKITTTEVYWERAAYERKVREWVDFHTLEIGPRHELKSVRRVGTLARTLRNGYVRYLELEIVRHGIPSRLARSQVAINSTISARIWLAAAITAKLPGTEDFRSAPPADDDVILIARTLGTFEVRTRYNSSGYLNLLSRQDATDALLGYFHHIDYRNFVAHHCYGLAHHTEGAVRGSAPGDPAARTILDVRHCPCGKHVYASSSGEKGDLAYFNVFVPGESGPRLNVHGVRIIGASAVCASPWPRSDALNWMYSGTLPERIGDVAVEWRHLEGGSLIEDRYNTYYETVVE